MDVAASIALLLGTVALGFRHGFDWDHIAAIADITSSAVGSDDRLDSPRGTANLQFSAESAADALDALASAAAVANLRAESFAGPRAHAFGLGTMYALGHASIVAVLGLAAFLFGVRLPEWIDPIMGVFVGLTLLVLGVWLLSSSYRFARHGHELRLRSRWMLILDGLRTARDRIRARRGIPVPESRVARSYGAGTSYGVGMIHGIGAETATQILLITALGGAAGQQLGVPLMASFIVGSLAGNTVIVAISASGFGSTRKRRRLRLLAGVVAGFGSIVIGAIFVFGRNSMLPDMAGFLGA